MQSLAPSCLLPWHKQHYLTEPLLIELLVTAATALHTQMGAPAVIVCDDGYFCLAKQWRGAALPCPLGLQNTHFSRLTNSLAAAIASLTQMGAPAVIVCDDGYFRRDKQWRGASLAVPLRTVNTHFYRLTIRLPRCHCFFHADGRPRCDRVR